MFGQIWRFLIRPLGNTQGRVMVGVLILTGMASLFMGAFFASAAWAVPAQVILAMTFVLSIGVIYTPPDGRLRLLAGAAPAVGAILIGLFLLPQWLPLLVGAGAGWFIAAMSLFRQQTSPEVMRAIRKMRRGEYKDAITEIEAVIKRDKPGAYRLRGMIFRIDGAG